MGGGHSEDELFAGGDGFRLQLPPKQLVSDPHLLVNFLFKGGGTCGYRREIRKTGARSARGRDARASSTGRGGGKVRRKTLLSTARREHACKKRPFFQRKR